MSEQFTGRAVSKGVSLPDDMWALLKERSARTGVPISTFVKRAVEEKLMDDVSKRHSELREPQTTGG